MFGKVKWSSFEVVSKVRFLGFDFIKMPSPGAWVLLIFYKEILFGNMHKLTEEW